MKRVTWFAAGVVTGAVGAVSGGRKVKRKAEQLKPVNMAKSTASMVKARVHDLRDALRDGRDAMHDKEDELRARRDGVGPDAEGPADPELVVIEGTRYVIVTEPAPGSAAGAATRRRSRRRPRSPR
jgi:hypothetical protein